MPQEKSGHDSNIFLKRLGERLRRLRGEASLRDFAPGIGLDAKALHRIERGEHNVTLRTLATICRCLKCEVGDLLDARPDGRKPLQIRAKKKTVPRVKKPS